MVADTQAVVSRPLRDRFVRFCRLYQSCGAIDSMIAAENASSSAGSLLASILSEDSFRPAEPKTLEETGLTAALIENLILKYISLIGSASGRQCSDNLCLSFGL